MEEMPAGAMEPEEGESWCSGELWVWTPNQRYTTTRTFLSYIFSIKAIESRSALAITVTSGEAHVLLVVFVSILHWSWRRKCLRFSVPASWDSPDSWSSHTARLFVTCGSSHAILIKGPFLEWSRRRCC